MTDQTTQPAAPDPCAPFEKDGVLDIGLMVDDATALVGCIYTEASKLTGLFGKQVAANVAQALIHLQRAAKSHQSAKKTGEVTAK